MRVAVIGAGISGISCAYYLSAHHEVTLFEKSDRIGGHTNTIEVQETATTIRAVDTGFIVCNDHTYPNFHRFLNDLQVPVRYADMSFSYTDPDKDLAYGSRSLDQLFAQRRNIANPKFLRMLLQIMSFWRVGTAALASNEAKGLTLQQFLDFHEFSSEIRSDYLIPISASIWSGSVDDILKFPADLLLSFYKNHGLLGYWNQPRWQTVVGGSHSYLRAFAKTFRGSIICNAAVTVAKHDQSWVLRTQGQEHRFDAVVIATHSDQVLPLFSSPLPELEEIFTGWSYQPNKTYLHTDRSFLPSNVRARASWNYQKEATGDSTHPVTVTYWMNLLQGFSSSIDYLVTLNPRREIDPSKIIREINYEHPRYDTAHERRKVALDSFQGTSNLYFCGAYQGFGFHEDGIASSLRVLHKLDPEHFLPPHSPTYYQPH